MHPSISITRTSGPKVPATATVITKLARDLELLGQTGGEKRLIQLELTESQVEGLAALGILGKRV